MKKHVVALCPDYGVSVRLDITGATVEDIAIKAGDMLQNRLRERDLREAAEELQEGERKIRRAVVAKHEGETVSTEKEKKEKPPRKPRLIDRTCPLIKFLDEEQKSIQLTFYPVESKSASTEAASSVAAKPAPAPVAVLTPAVQTKPEQQTQSHPVPKDVSSSPPTKTVTSEEKRPMSPTSPIPATNAPTASNHMSHNKTDSSGSISNFTSRPGRTVRRVASSISRALRGSLPSQEGLRAAANAAAANTGTTTSNAAGPSEGTPGDGKGKDKPSVPKKNEARYSSLRIGRDLALALERERLDMAQEWERQHREMKAKFEELTQRIDKIVTHNEELREQNKELRKESRELRRQGEKMQRESAELKALSQLQQRETQALKQRSELLGREVEDLRRENEQNKEVFEDVWARLHETMLACLGDEASLRALQRHKIIDMCRESAAKLGAKSSWDQVVQEYPSKEEQRHFVAGILGRRSSEGHRRARLSDEETLVDLIITPAKDAVARYKE